MADITSISVCAKSSAELVCGDLLQRRRERLHEVRGERTVDHCPKGRVPGRPCRSAPPRARRRLLKVASSVTASTTSSWRVSDQPSASLRATGQRSRRSSYAALWLC